MLTLKILHFINALFRQYLDTEFIRKTFTADINIFFSFLVEKYS
jgi:hypothetical protein